MQIAKVAEIFKREGNSIGEYSSDPKRMLNVEVVRPKNPSLIQGYYLWTSQSLASTRKKERGSYNTPTSPMGRKISSGESKDNLCIMLLRPTPRYFPFEDYVWETVRMRGLCHGRQKPVPSSRHDSRMQLGRSNLPP